MAEWCLRKPLRRPVCRPPTRRARRAVRTRLPETRAPAQRNLRANTFERRPEIGLSVRARVVHGLALALAPRRKALYTRERSLANGRSRPHGAPPRWP